jgi:hypothetical protein
MNSDIKIPIVCVLVGALSLIAVSYMEAHKAAPAPLTQEEIAINARVAAIDNRMQELQDERDQLDPPDDPEEDREPPDDGWDLN